MAAARDTFWEMGYELTSIGDLERRTGLNRSSLYQAFGSKRALFNTALRCYFEDEFDGMLRRLRDAGRGPSAAAAFFNDLAGSFRADPSRAARGCLLVNAIAELGRRDPDLARAAAAHRDRLRDAFAAALSGVDITGADDVSASTRLRAKLLASTTLGIFLTARIDPVDAADLCDSIAAEVSTWVAPE